MSIPPFVHLHVHSHYSLLDGAAKLPKLIQTAKNFGMPAVALTDHGNLFGAIEFYTLAIKAGIKPIIGYEAYIVADRFLQKDDTEIKDEEDRKDVKKGKRDYRHITLLAKDYQGYKNLMKLASEAYLTGFYYKPRIDKKLLFEHSKGLIVLSGCLTSEVNRYIVAGNLKKAEQTIAEYRDVFKEDYYLEVQNNGVDEQNKVNEILVQMSQKFDLPLVITNDIHYLTKEDAASHDILLCLQTSKTRSAQDRWRFPTQEFYMKSPEQMYAESQYFAHAAENTVAIAEKVNIQMPAPTIHLPKYECPGEKTNEEYLRELCEVGLIARYGTVNDSLRKRFEHEFSVICKMGFAPYFLIVWDFINYAKNHGIWVGPGRGSAAGSVVSYVLYITNLDPIRYNLIFERFLNEGRKEMPDIDIDFETNRREEVIQYVSKKYGKLRVCQIITFGTFAARAVIRDVGRILEKPLKEVTAITQKVPNTPKITLEQALNDPENKEFREIYDSNSTAKEIIDIAQSLEGFARQPGTHAAGIIIADADITEYCPLYRDPKHQSISTQYSMEHVTNLGLLKMDFLGLNTLTLLEEALKIIKSTRGEKIELDKIPTDDKNTYNLLMRGETNGIFQLESDGMTKLVQRLRPDRFEDIIALVALYRPGPLDSGMVDSYCDRKHKIASPQYYHPLLHDILQETYGNFIYQEQIMQTASILAGFSLTEADKLRKAMGKKNMELMKTYRTKFIDGATKLHNVPQELSEEIFDIMEKFAEYGFNKSHSAAYALITYQTAYLKANYRKEYMTALMTIESQDLEKINKYLHECEEHGIAVLPPDLNESQESFWPTSNGIRFGFTAIKGLGEKAIESILNARKVYGKFTSLFDLCEKAIRAGTPTMSIDKRALESLIKSGSLDSFGISRDRMFGSIPIAAEYLASLKKQDKKQENFLGSIASESEENQALAYATDFTTWDDKTRQDYEKEALGFIFNNPSKHVLLELKSIATRDIIRLQNDKESILCTVAGKISEIREISVKKEGKNKGRKMAQFRLDDNGTSCDCVCFPDVFDQAQDLLKEDEVVLLNGKSDWQKDKLQIIVVEIISLQRALSEYVDEVFCILENPTEDDLIPIRNILFKLHKNLPNTQPNTDQTHNTPQNIPTKSSIQENLPNHPHTLQQSNHNDKQQGNRQNTQQESNEKKGDTVPLTLIIKEENKTTALRVHENFFPPLSALQELRTQKLPCTIKYHGKVPTRKS